MNGRRVSRWFGWTGLLGGVALLPALACGPWFPSSYLEGGADTMSPYVDFAFALLDIASALPPDDASPTAFASSDLSALDAGTADLAAVLATPEAAVRWPRDRRAKWLRDYRQAAHRVHDAQPARGRLGLPRQILRIRRTPCRHSRGHTRFAVDLTPVSLTPVSLTPVSLIRQPGSATLTRVISCPRAAVASSACAKGSAPAATSAAYSPSEWPMT